MTHEIWHYADGENVIGPFTEERLREFHSARVVVDDTLVCQGESMGWSRFADVFPLSKGAAGERDATKPAKRPNPRQPQSRLLIVGLALLVAGIVCLVLPLKWAPLVIWLAPPALFAATIITGHLTAATGHTYFLGLHERKSGRWGAGLVYFLLGISCCAALLVISNLREAQPAYLWSDWKGVDVFQPAPFSWAVLRSDVSVDVPSGSGLQPTERRAAEELAHLVGAKNRLWLILRMKIEQAGSARQFARVLDQAVIDFKTLGRRLEAVPRQFDVEGFEANRRLAVVMVRMVQESNAKTAGEVQVCNAALAADVQRFGSDPEVQQLMPQLVAALNPPDILTGLAAALRNLGTALSEPSGSDRIEAARTSVEKAILNLDGSVQLDPDLQALLAKALDRSIDLKPSERRENGPWNTYYTVVGEQSSAAKLVTTATNSAVNLLTSCPTFLLVRPRSTRSTSATDAPSNAPNMERMYLDRATLQKYFGSTGFLPRLGDNLEEVAGRASTKIVHCVDHNYVTVASPKAILDGSCTFTAVGTSRDVEAVVVYAPQILDDQEHDLTPLANQIRTALAPAVFAHAASTNLLEVWASADQTLIVCVRKFPKFETGGHTYHGSSNLVFGNAAGAKLITDKQYFARAPNPFGEDVVTSATAEAKSTPKPADDKEPTDPQPELPEFRPTFTPTQRLAKVGTFFLLRYISVKTARGSYGFEPGRQVHVVRTVVGRPTLVVSDGQCEMEVDPSLLTNDLDVAAALGRADAAMQEQITTQADKTRTTVSAKQHQLDIEHARDVEAAERIRVQSSRMHATPNPLDQRP